MSLHARLRYVLDSGRVPSARHWALAAGLSGTYFGTLFTRMGRDEEADIRRAELVALARAAGVSLTWLATGDGSPDDLPPRTVEREDRYPNRASAVAMARELGLSTVAIDEVQALALQGDDPPVRAWLEQIQRRDRDLADPFARATASTLDEADDAATRPRRRR